MEVMEEGSQQDLGPPGSLAQLLAQGDDSPSEDDDSMPVFGQGGGHGSKRGREDTMMIQTVRPSRCIGVLI